MSYQNIKIEDVLDEMKTRISSNQMSLLVGSGVSCCACNLYQNWAGLITDMVAFLYPYELERRGIVVEEVKDYYCHYTLMPKDVSKDEEFIKNTVKDIIQREGVLDIPSKFAKRVGLRESIEAYIESHTPRIDYSTNTISLFGESCSIDKDKDLRFLTTMMNVGWNAIFTTNYDNLLDYASLDIEGKGLTECCVAAELSLRKMDEFVVKLHGSIDFEHSRNGFDGDVHRKYVLTREDYDDYPSKHEAFMQLMRISLLKDSFCLVGFSGTDPNFIAWISWVRDILEAKKKSDDGSVEAKDIKIFFIDCFETSLDDATAQFFDNHKIHRIVLPSKKVRDLIDPNGAAPEDSEEYRRHILERLFSYIKIDKITANDSTPPDQGTAKHREMPDVRGMEPKGLSDTLVRQSKKEDNGEGIDRTKEVPESNTLWSQAYTLSGNLHRETTVIEAGANELLSMRSHMRIVRGIHSQLDFLRSIPYKSTLTELEAKLTILAFEQKMYVRDDEVSILKKIKTVLKDTESRDRILKLENRILTLKNPSNAIVCGTSSDRVINEKCLRFAFTFDFLRLKTELSEWNPGPEFAINKAVLLSLVDHDACSRMLTTTMLENIPTRVERLRATQLANILMGSFKDSFSMKAYSSMMTSSIFSLQDWFFGKSLQPKERIRTYGNINDYNSFDEETALRSLSFLIETPVFVQLGMWSIVNNVQWYKVAHKLFERYPYPVMFYTTTMNDTNTLRRIGQDYAYSKSLHKMLPELVGKMFALLTDKMSPLGYWGRKNFCVLLEELIKSVPSKHWDKYILQLWDHHKERMFDDSSSTDELHKLIYCALSLTNDVQLVATVICDTLENVRKNKKYDFAQNLFYYSRLKHNKVIAKTVAPRLAIYIDDICDARDYILLGNLYRLLTKPQITRISKTIPHVIQNMDRLPSSINGLIFFAKHNAATLAMIRQRLVGSPSLWDNGAREGGGYTMCDFIPIVELDKELKWTKDEILLIYNKLVASAEQILGTKYTLLDHLMNRENLFYEMLQFIDLHRNELEGVEFSVIYQQIENEFKELTSYENIEKSIYSENEEAISAALEVLVNRIKHDGIVPHLGTINTLITRILCRNRHGYQSVLNYLQYYLRTFAKDKETLEKITQLRFFIDSLTMEVFKELEQNVYFCSELTIMIAKHLRKNGIASDGVSYWMNVKKSNFFNWSTSR